MFAIQWNSLVAGAIAGGVGGGLGAAIGYGIDRLTGQTLPFGRLLRGVCVAVGAIWTFYLWQLLGDRPADRTSIDRQLGQIPAYRVLKQYYPASYDTMLTNIGALSTGGTQVQAEDALRPILGRLLVQQVVHADDENIAAYVHVVEQEAATARDVSPGDCWALLDGHGRLGFDPQQVFTPDEVQSELALDAKVLEQTAQSPLPAPQPLDAATRHELAAAAFAQLAPEDQQAVSGVVASARQPETDAEMRAYCNLTIGMLDAALQHSPDDARAIMGGLVSPS